MTDNEIIELDECITWLCSLLGERKFVVAGAQASDIAKSHADQQPYRWQQLLTIIRSSKIKPVSAGFHSLSHLHSLLGKALNCSITVDGADKATVVSTLPILMDTPAASRCSQAAKHPFQMAAILASRCSFALSQQSDPQAGRFLELVGAAQAIAIHESQSFSETFKRQLSLIGNDAQRQNHAGQMQIAEALKRFDTFAADAGNSFDKLKDKVEGACSSAAKAIAEIKSERDNLKDNWQQELERERSSLRELAREFTKVETSIELWSSKARAHAITYRVLGSVFCITLLSIAVASVGWGPAYVEKLGSLTGDKQFLGIALVAIPTLAIAWFLRFIARVTI
jgi:hypothetical protein